MHQKTHFRFSHRLAILLFVLITGNSLATFAQVGINNTDPHPSAILDLKSREKGLLIPRMSPNDREVMNQGPDFPANGLMVFDSVQNIFFFYLAGTNTWFPINPWSFEIPLNNTGQSKPNFLYTHPALNSNIGIGVVNPTEKLEVDGNIKSTGNIISSDVTATGEVTGSKVYGEGTVPPGAIMMWSGTTAPAGWALCNGNNDTPDLRGRFIVGYDSDTRLDAGTDYVAIGNTGGETKVSLTQEEMPPHYHKYIDVVPKKGDDATGSTRTRHQDEETTIKYTGIAGGVHDGNGFLIDSYKVKPHENRPPYYTLAYIMKLPY